MLRDPLSLHQGPVDPFGLQLQLFRDGKEIAPMGDVNILADIQSVSTGYGADGNTASFLMWDAQTIDRASWDGYVSSAMPTPRQGDQVIITARDKDDIATISAVKDDSNIIFRGMIQSISSQRSATGKRYAIDCIGLSNRLNEYHVTMKANPLNNSFNPSPTFDPVTGAMLSDTEPQTIANVITSILNFRDVWPTQEMFSYGDIVWSLSDTGGSLESDPRCGGYIPSNIMFQDEPKDEAIQQVLSKAGNYKLFYDPTIAPNGKFCVVELNAKCNRCGPEWDIQFPVSYSAQGNGEGYVHDLDVISDSTSWTSAQSANVVRVTSGHIRFYSGQYIIPEMIENKLIPNPDYDSENPDDAPELKAASDTDRFLQIEQDTIAEQKLRAVNEDTTYYRFANPIQHVMDDGRKYQQYPVGMPLFPDWNPFQDFLPEYITIVNAQRPPSGTLPYGATAEDYAWESEFLKYTQGTAAGMGASRFSRLDNLKVYQAWYATQPCPACNGSGNVAKIYANDDNTPAMSWVDIGPSLSVTGTADGKPKHVKRPIVTNYIMNPNMFGDPSYDVGSSTLAPWVKTDDQLYPIPWKNLCPYCRGVGMEPEYKIRNIESVLFEGRNLQVTDGLTGKEIPLDPEFTQAAPETWGQSQTRVIVSSQAYVQLEHPIGTTNRLPADDTNKNLSWQELAGGKSAPYLFPHPLHDYKFRLIDIAGISSGSASSNVISSTSNSKALFTTIVFGEHIQSRPRVDNSTGRVIFQSPVCITAEMSWTMPSYVNTGNQRKVAIGNDGLISMLKEQPKRAKNNQKPVGYWRPARAWMQFFYRKEDYYHRPSVNYTEFNYTNADGDTNTYLAKAMIVDGKWCCEVAKKFPDTSGDVPNEIMYDRVVQDTIEDDDSTVETTQEDLLLMMIPPRADMTPSQLEQAKRDAGCAFPRARLFRWDAPSPGEKMYELEGISDAIADNALQRPRFYSWRLKDDRSKLMSVAVRRLEEANNLHVSGVLQIKGKSHQFHGGLGWVDYPDQARASVSRVTHDFTNGWVINLELTREVARYGETPPVDKANLVDLQNEFKMFKRSVKYRMQSSGTTASIGPQIDVGNMEN